MYIKQLKLKQFRNYENLDISFEPGCTIIKGNNAQGKTNILEALYIAGTSKSHRSKHDKELIRFGEDEAHIQVDVIKPDWQYKIDIHLKKGKNKGIAVNRVPLKKVSELFGKVNFIFFSPEDLVIVKEGPSHRRRFLDSELCQLSKVYLNHSHSYQKILNDRNKVLKEYKGSQDDMILDVLDEQLVTYGQSIIQHREEFVKELNEIAAIQHHKITHGLESLEVIYEKSVEVNDFLEALKNNRKKDLYHKNTSVGPQRDDLNFLINGIDSRKFGSQGQQRTVALSLKLSEIQIVKKRIDDYPILLLDDVLSELDQNRQRDLIDSLEGIQTIMTCTGMDEQIKKRLKADQIYEIQNGKLV